MSLLPGFELQYPNPWLRAAGMRGVGTAGTALSKSSLAAKELLRHSSVSTTERHDVKDVPEKTLEAMKQLESLCTDRTKSEGTKRSEVIEKYGAPKGTILERFLVNL